jgi:hypothetical protein
MPTAQTPIHSGFDGMTASKPEAELRDESSVHHTSGTPCKDGQSG